jgi:hypothetical protein
MPKGLSEVIIRRRAGNAMAKLKKDKMINSDLQKTTQNTED